MTENIFRASDPEYDRIYAKIEEIEQSLTPMVDRIWCVERAMQRLSQHMLKMARAFEQDTDNL